MNAAARPVAGSRPRRSPRRARGAGLSVEQAGDLLKQLGLRRTLVRICVLQILSQRPRALSQADVAAALANYGFDDSTIFRSLGDLVELGLISRVDSGDKTWRFWFRPEQVRRADAAAGCVMHVCRDCSRVTPVPDDELQLSFRGHALSQANVDDVVLRGRCRDCRENQE